MKQANDPSQPEKSGVLPPKKITDQALHQHIKSTVDDRTHDYSRLRACPDCDLLQVLPVLKRGQQARCCRCNTVLIQQSKYHLSDNLALAWTAWLLFILSNAFPLMSLKSLGIYQESTLFSATFAMFNTGYPFLAALIFMTTILFPLLSLSLILYVLYAVRSPNFKPQAVAPIFRFIIDIDRWGMLEIYLLSILVAMVKLSEMAEVIFGISMYTYIGLIICMAWLNKTLDKEAIWEKIILAQIVQRKRITQGS
ncbi:MAG TPA: paraquat-inducible protein A [Thiothrix sp.]|nr:paraquat-inducible protein A [Thiothrix sp.]